MNKFNKYIYAFCFIFNILWIQSCYDDKGNYDYIEINDVQIATIGTYDTDYTFHRYIADTISIKPVLTSSLLSDFNEDNYKFEWVWLDARVNGDLVNQHVISTLKEWDKFVPPLPAGENQIYYRITEKKTGIQWISNIFKIYVNNDIGRGFFIMCDVDNETRIDFINQFNNKFSLRTDIISASAPNMPALGKPSSVCCYKDGNSPKMSTPNGYAVCVLTETGAYRLDPADFSYQEIYDLNYMVIGNLPDDFKVQYLYAPNAAGEAALMYNNKDIYMYEKALQIFWTFGAGINFANNKRFNASHIAAITQGGRIFYDIDSKSFVRNTGGSTVGSYFSTANETHFKYNNTGLDLIFIHARRFEAPYENTIYAVQKSADNKLLLVSFVLLTEQQRFADSLDGLPEITEAKEFAMDNLNSSTSLLYYRTDKKIYAYHMGNKTVKSVYTASGSQLISRIKFVLAGENDLDFGKDKLMVFTYDPSKPSDACGKLEVMSPQLPNGELVINKYNNEPMVWEGLGKVVDADWKER